MTADDMSSFELRRRKRSALSFGWILIAIAVVVAIIIAITFLRGMNITNRPNEMKTTRVILPPPPPPPPPEVKPEEKPPEPKPMPVEEPTDSPPPPTPQAQPAPGNDALTAREGAGPSNYGLTIGDGSGSRIGGKVGSGLGGFNRAAYASYLEGEMRRAFEGSSKLRTTALRTRARVWIDPAGKITRVEIVDSALASERADAIRAALVGRSVRPPDASLAMPVALSLDFRRSG